MVAAPGGSAGGGRVIFAVTAPSFTSTLDALNAITFVASAMMIVPRSVSSPSAVLLPGFADAALPVAGRLSILPHTVRDAASIWAVIFFTALAALNNIR